MISRRSFVIGAAGAAVTGCTKLRLFERTPTIYSPGMREGHMLRDAASWPSPSSELDVDVVILGSGVSGLTAAWKLAKEGHQRFLLIEGPELTGNASGGRFGELAFPRGAHYLPLPSMESTHIRELLFELGVIQDEPYAARPYFDESCVVHAPDERLYLNGSWQDGLVPNSGIPPAELAQQKRFFSYVESLKNARGRDGKKLFCIPLALSSADPEWTKLDNMSVRRWLDENGYTAPSLHWYLNYICRDEYGAEYDKVSAWSGLHYFASRAGQARNAADGAVLTWPSGLNALMTKMIARIDAARTSLPPWHRAGYALRVEEVPTGVNVLCMDGATAGSFTVRAKRAICAMPLQIAARVVRNISEYGFDPTTHMPSYAPWMVSNFLMDGFPAEHAGVPLAWDNVVYRGQGLGYVVSTHQDIRVAPPRKTVFSAYQALSKFTPTKARQWLAGAHPDALYEEAASDLKEVYGFDLIRHIEALDITLRGHAMASPLQGFLSNRGMTALQKADGRILFAHSDLSGFSVFEEAAWWGYQAALRLLQ